MANRLSTGIPVLDRQLDGGIPPGSLVLLLADPASQSELFLYELATTRRTLYLTTIRTDQAVRDAVDRYRGGISRLTVRDVDSAAPLDTANRLVKDLPEDSNLVVDVMNTLEATDTSRYRSFLNELQNHMVNTGGVAMLHAMKDGSSTATRNMSAHMADVVFDLQTEIRSNEIVNRLAVPKFRGGQALEETIKLKLTGGITIDTSRDIA
ncbi:MAG: RAD55 family ATPase [Haloferacaceae archaeon]